MFWIFKQPTKFQPSLPLTDSPLPIIILMTTYLLFALKCGKIFMQHRQPYNIKKIMLTYNAIQVIYNSILFCFCFKYLFVNPIYDLRCMESLSNDHPIKFIEIKITYLSYLNKWIDLCDTIFFILRKNYNQVTFLHIYHHAGMAFGGYMLVRTYGAGGHVSIMALVNTFVHTIMYSYYFLSGLNSEAKKNIWWKKYLTLIQLMQFLIVLLHTLYVLIFSTDCGYPKIWLWVYIVQSVVMLVMFSNFYVKAYRRPKQHFPKTATKLG